MLASALNLDCRDAHDAPRCTHQPGRLRTRGLRRLVGLSIGTVRSRRADAEGFLRTKLCISLTLTKRRSRRLAGCFERHIDIAVGRPEQRHVGKIPRMACWNEVTSRGPFPSQPIEQSTVFLVQSTVLEWEQRFQRSSETLGRCRPGAGTDR